MNLYFGETIKLFMKTLPFAMVRTGIYLAFGVASIVYFLLVVGVATLFSKIGGSAGSFMAFIVVAGGFGGGWGLVHLAREWILHMVKAGHVAVATAYLTQGKLPEGQNQYEVGKKLVTEQFVDVNVLFVVDGLVRGSVRAINRLIDDVTSLIPLPGMHGLAQWTGRIVDMAVQFVDETILSYSLTKGEKNVWNSAAEGVVLYAQSYREVLKNAAVMAVLAWISYGALVVALGILCWPIAYSIDSDGWMKNIFFLSPFVFGYVLKLSLVNPFAMMSVLVTFHKHAMGKPISAEWQGRIEAASDKFRELRQKAEAFARDRMAKPAAASSAPAAGPIPIPEVDGALSAQADKRGSAGSGLGA